LQTEQRLSSAHSFPQWEQLDLTVNVWIASAKTSAIFRWWWCFGAIKMSLYKTVDGHLDGQIGGVV